MDLLTYLSGYQIAPFFIDSFMQKYYDVNYLHLFCAQMAILPLKKSFCQMAKRFFVQQCIEIKLKVFAD